MTNMTPDEVKAIMDAVLREVVTSGAWDEIKDMSLADLCARNQDALIDDISEDDPRDAEYRAGMVDHVKTYDKLLDTRRADDILPARDKS